MASAQLQAKIDEWLKWDQNSTTKQEIEGLVSTKNYSELESRLMKRMEFGTAGLRSRMAAGYTMMNDLTIIQTGQGFLEYLKKHFGQERLSKSGIVVGYDARHNSSRFARLTANIFLKASVPVYLFRQISMTPFVPYGVLKYKCCAGIMVTASHNPKEDNGYKVYLDNGAQIIPPHDEGIAQCILDNLEPRESSWQIEDVDAHPLHKDPFDEVHRDYFRDLKKVCYRESDNSNTSLVFTYTAMHGVGYEFSVESFKRFNHKPFVPVVEQIKPDPEFPTVKFPNPEEGKSALNLAIKTANENKSQVILANDPDADRLAVAEKQSNGEWKVFNGNEIGALLGWWMWHNFKLQNKELLASKPDVLSKVYMLYSTVSSHILKAMAEKEGFKCEDTLTGFKWMANRAQELLHADPETRVLFCFEEAIGFMCGTNVFDKDGVSAEGCMAELAVYLHEVEHKKLNDHLDWIYQNYGYHVSYNSYYICHEHQVIDKMFHRLRHFDDQNSQEYSYPRFCGPYEISKIRDLTAGLLIDFSKGGERSKPNFPIQSSHMITFYLTNGCVMTIRTSGTEPKIKWYSEMKQLDKSKSREQVKDELYDVVKYMVSEFYQPEINNLKARTA